MVSIFYLTTHLLEEKENKQMLEKTAVGIVSWYSGLTIDI